MKALRLRRLGLIAGAAAIATTGLVLVAEPAFAVPGRVVVTSTTASNSTSPKGGVLACPNGTVPLGGGGAINGAAGVTIVQDNPTAAGWAFAAIEQGAGTAANWSLTTWAVCATPPAGYQQVVGNGTITPPAAAKAVCPTTKKLIGVGGTLDTAVGDNVRVITSIRPDSALTTAIMTATLDPLALTGPASNLFHAYAICVNPLTGMQFVTASTAANSVDKSVSVSCPFPTIPQSVGATVRNGTGLVNLTNLNPSTNPAQASAREHTGGFGGDWVLEVFAICVR